MPREFSPASKQINKLTSEKFFQQNPQQQQQQTFLLNKLHKDLYLYMQKVLTVVNYQATRRSKFR